MAWLASVPQRGLEEHQSARVAGRNELEPEALVGCEQLGSASCSVREPHGPPEGAMAALSRQWVIIVRSETRVPVN